MNLGHVLDKATKVFNKVSPYIAGFNMITKPFRESNFVPSNNAFVRQEQGKQIAYR